MWPFSDDKDEAVEGQPEPKAKGAPSLNFVANPIIINPTSYQVILRNLKRSERICAVLETRAGKATTHWGKSPASTEDLMAELRMRKAGVIAAGFDEVPETASQFQKMADKYAKSHKSAKRYIESEGDS